MNDTSLELRIAVLERDVKSLSSKVNVPAKIDYRLIFSGLLVVFTALGGAWRLADLKVESALSPLAVTGAQFRATQATHDRDITALKVLQTQFAEIQHTDTAKLGITANDLAQVEARLRNLEQDITKYREATAQSDNRLQVLIARLGVEVDNLHKRVFSSDFVP